MGKNRFPNPFDVRPKASRKQHASSQEDVTVSSAHESSFRPESANQLIPMDKSADKQSSDLINWIDSLKGRVNSTLHAQLIQSRSLNAALANEKKRLELRDQIFDDGFEQLQQQHKLVQAAENDESVEEPLSGSSEEDNSELEEEDVIEVLSSGQEEASGPEEAAYGNHANGLQEYIDHGVDEVAEADDGDTGVYSEDEYDEDKAEEVLEDSEEEEEDNDLADELPEAQEDSESEVIHSQTSGKHLAPHGNRGLHDLRHRSYIHDNEERSSDSMYGYAGGLEQEDDYNGSEQENYSKAQEGTDDNEAHDDSIVVLDSDEEIEAAAETEASESIGETDTEDEEEEEFEQAEDQDLSEEDKEEDRRHSASQIHNEDEMEVEHTQGEATNISQLQSDYSSQDELDTAENLETDAVQEGDNFYSIDLNEQAQEIANQFYDQLNANTLEETGESNFSFLDSHDLAQLAEVALGFQEQQGYQADYEPTDSKPKDAEIPDVDLSPMAPIPAAFDDLSSLSHDEAEVEKDGLSEGSLADSEDNQSVAEIDEPTSNRVVDEGEAKQGAKGLEREKEQQQEIASDLESEDSFDGGFVFKTIKQEEPEDVLRKLRETEKKFSVKLNVTDELEEQIKSARGASYQPEDFSSSDIMREPAKPVLKEVEVEADDSFTVIDTTRDEEFSEAEDPNADKENEDTDPHHADLNYSSEVDNPVSLPKSIETSNSSEKAGPSDRLENSTDTIEVKAQDDKSDISNDDSETTEVQEGPEPVNQHSSNEAGYIKAEDKIVDAVFVETELSSNQSKMPEQVEVEIEDEEKDEEKEHDFDVGSIRDIESSIKKPELYPLEDTTMSELDYTFDQTETHLATDLTKPVLEEIDESMDLDMSQAAPDDIDKMVSEAVDMLQETGTEVQSEEDQVTGDGAIVAEESLALETDEVDTEERPFSPGLGITISQTSKEVDKSGFGQTLGTLSENPKEVISSEFDEAPAEVKKAPNSERSDLIDETEETETYVSSQAVYLENEPEQKEVAIQEELDQSQWSRPDDSIDYVGSQAPARGNLVDEALPKHEDGNRLFKATDTVGESDIVERGSTHDDCEDNESTFLPNENAKMAGQESHANAIEVFEGDDSNADDIALDNASSVSFEVDLDTIQKPELKSLPEEEQQSEVDDITAEPEVEEPLEEEGMVFQYADDDEVAVADGDLIHPTGEIETWEEAVQEVPEFDEELSTNYQLEIVSDSSEEGDEASLRPATIEEPFTIEEEELMRVVEVADDEEYPLNEPSMQLPVIDTPEPEVMVNSANNLNYEILEEDGDELTVEEIKYDAETIEITPQEELEQNEAKQNEQQSEVAEREVEIQEGQEGTIYESKETPDEIPTSLKRAFSDLNEEDSSQKSKKQRSSWFGWFKMPLIFTKQSSRAKEELESKPEVLDTPQIIITQEEGTADQRTEDQDANEVSVGEENILHEHDEQANAESKEDEDGTKDENKEDEVEYVLQNEVNSEAKGKSDDLESENAKVGLDVNEMTAKEAGDASNPLIEPEVDTNPGEANGVNATKKSGTEEEDFVSGTEKEKENPLSSSEDEADIETKESEHSYVEGEQEIQPLPKQRKPRRVLGLDIEPANLEPSHSLRNGASFGGSIEEVAQPVTSPVKSRNRSSRSKRRLSQDLSSQRQVSLKSENAGSRKSSARLSDETDDHPSARTRSKSPLKISMNEILDEDLPISQRVRRSRKRRGDDDAEETKAEVEETDQERKPTKGANKRPTSKKQRNADPKEEEPRGRSKRRH